MAMVFTSFAVVAGLLGVLLPHIAFRLGFLMMTIYLSLAGISALLGLSRGGR